MSITKQKKEQIVTDLESLFSDSKSIAFVTFTGLNVSGVDALRNECRANNVRYVVAKKSLLKIAADKAGVVINPKEFSGEIAAAFSLGDEVAAAKILANFAKKHEMVKFVGGVLEKKFLSVDEITALSKIPNKEELLAKMVGSLNAPLSGLVNVLVGNLRGLINVLQALAKKTA